MNLFRGMTSGRDGPRIFGGHVIAQSLMAAYETVEDRICHSLHCYFIRPGDPSIPILYDVDRSRDGASFTTRRVTAIQHGQQIFNLAASFQVHEEGFEHQAAMPDVPPPDDLPDSFEQFKAMMEKMPESRRGAADDGPAPADRAAAGQSAASRGEGRRRSAMSGCAPGPKSGPTSTCIRRSWPTPQTWSLMETAMRPHAVTWQTGGMQSASLDHAIWFHRPLNFNDWHLYAQESPSASGARGFIRGQVFSQSGVLVASVAQEGLFRLRKPR